MLDSQMPDSSMPDSHMPDSPMPESQMPDSQMPDSTMLDSQIDSIAPAPPWGERRGDGDHYAPVPYVDPGGRQPEVIGALCGRGLNDLKRIVSVTFVF